MLIAYYIIGRSIFYDSCVIMDFELLITRQVLKSKISKSIIEVHRVETKLQIFVFLWLYIKDLSTFFLNHSTEKHNQVGR